MGIVGHDIEFVEELPDHMKCAICTFTLKDPIQLAKCGHRFCYSCFEKVKDHSARNDVDILCPIDRTDVDINEVFRDRAVERVILDLQVKCTHRAHGCFWVGELRHLEAHVQNKCKFQVNLNVMDILKDLQLRLENCEKQLVDKDARIDRLSNELTERCAEFEKTVTDLQKNCEDLKRQVVESKFELELSKEKSEEGFVHDTKKRKLDHGKANHAYNFSDKENVVDDGSPSDDKETTLYKPHFKCTVPKEQFQKICDAQNFLEKKVAIIMDVVNFKDITFNWFIWDYAKHKERGSVFSEPFYGSMLGHRCQLGIQWHGENKDTLGIHLHLEKKCEYPSPLSNTLNLTLRGKNGLKKCFSIDCEFRNVAEMYGTARFIKMPELQAYISTNIMVVVCQLIPLHCSDICNASLISTE